MPVGSDVRTVLPSYVAVGKETTWGTYASATTALEFISCSFKTEIESQKLDSIGLNRGFTKRVQLNKSVAGSLEMNLHTVESTPLIANAMGGVVTTTPGSTGAYLHSISAGNMDTGLSSLSFNVRKGASHAFHYTGGRVNVMKISAEAGDLVKASFDMIFKDSTQLSDDIAASLSITSILPMTFVNGTFRYAATEALAGTSTAEECIQGFELEVNNNLAADAESRCLGSNLLGVLPPTRREVNLTITQRWDTTTTYQRFLQATQGAVELYFRGNDSLTSDFFHEITIRLPKVFQNSSDPTLEGSDSIIQSEITYDVLVDNPATTTGKDIGITVRNNVASY